MDSTTPPQSDTHSESIAAEQPTGSKASSKKLLYGILAGLGLLLVILIVLVAMLLAKKEEPQQAGAANNGDSTQTAQSSQADKNQAKKIVKTVPLNMPNLELLIYEPKQSASNTTINYGFRNTCENCKDTIFASAGENFGYGYIIPTDSYLLDDQAGQKYFPIKDEDNKVLATPSCDGRIAAGKTIDCFMAFTKVNSGTTVSIIFDKLRIDGVRIP